MWVTIRCASSPSSRLPIATWIGQRYSGILPRMVTRCLGICLLLGLASLLGQTGCKTSTAYRGELIQPPAQRATQAAGDANRPNEDAEALEAVRERLRKNNDPYLKCHFQDGSVIVLQDWHVVDNTVSGKGLKYTGRVGGGFNAAERAQ